MGIIKKLLRTEENNYNEIINEENSKLRKKLKRNNRDVIEIINERDEIKDELLGVYRKRSLDFDKVLMFKEEYAKYYNMYKEQKKEIAELKQELRKKEEELQVITDDNKNKDEIIKGLSIPNSIKRTNNKRKSIKGVK